MRPRLLRRHGICSQPCGTLQRRAGYASIALMWPAHPCRRALWLILSRPNLKSSPASRVCPGNVGAALHREPRRRITRGGSPPEAKAVVTLPENAGSPYRPLRPCSTIVRLRGTIMRREIRGAPFTRLCRKGPSCLRCLVDARPSPRRTSGYRRRSFKRVALELTPAV